VNNLFIYSSHTRYSRLLSARSEKDLRNALRIEHFMWEGPRRPCGFTAARSSYHKMWVGLNGFDPRTNLELGSVRIGTDYMNLVAVISRYTRVPVALSWKNRYVT